MLAAVLNSPGYGAGAGPRFAPQHGQFKGPLPSDQELGVYGGGGSGAPVCCVMILADLEDAHILQVAKLACVLWVYISVSHVFSGGRSLCARESRR
jgi:hypothetical protein